VGAEKLPSLLTGTIVLAIVANSYELLCTAGFPMVYTRALTLHSVVDQRATITATWHSTI
jgi:hypothetical protein